MEGTGGNRTRRAASNGPNAIAVTVVKAPNQAPSLRLESAVLKSSGSADGAHCSRPSFRVLYGTNSNQAVDTSLGACSAVECCTSFAPETPTIRTHPSRDAGRRNINANGVKTRADFSGCSDPRCVISESFPLDSQPMWQRHTKKRRPTDFESNAEPPAQSP
jgi:hypothetical protein